MKKFYAGLVIGIAVTTFAAVMSPPCAHADAGSYLAAAHEDPALRGVNDLWLMAVGQEVCAGRVVDTPGYGPAGYAVTRLAHRELCP